MRRGTVLFSGLGASAIWVAAACGGPSKLAASGEACFRATDCELGLICSPERKCTDDTSAIDIRPDASGTTGVGGGPPADASAGSSDAQGSGGAAGASGAGAAGSGAAGAGGSSTPVTDDAMPVGDDV